MLPIEMLANAVSQPATPVVNQQRIVQAPVQASQNNGAIQSQVASDFVRNFLNVLGAGGQSQPGQQPAPGPQQAQAAPQAPGQLNPQALVALRPPEQQGVQGVNPNAEVVRTLLRLLLGIG